MSWCLGDLRSVSLHLLLRYVMLNDVLPTSGHPEPPTTSRLLQQKVKHLLACSLWGSESGGAGFEDTIVP